MSICFTSGLYLENPLNSLYISYSGILDWRLSAECSLGLSSLGSARYNFASKSASFFFAAASRSSNPLMVRLYTWIEFYCDSVFNIRAIIPALRFLYSLACARASLNAFVGSFDVMVFLIILNTYLIVDCGAGVMIDITSVPQAIAYLISIYWFFWVLNAMPCSCSDLIRAAASAVSAGLTSIIWD